MNEDKLIMSMDIAKPDSIDCSAIVGMCGNCRSIIYCEAYVINATTHKHPKSCPICGTHFKVEIIME